MRLGKSTCDEYAEEKTKKNVISHNNLCISLVFLFICQITNLVNIIAYWVLFISDQIVDEIFTITSQVFFL